MVKPTLLPEPTCLHLRFLDASQVGITAIVATPSEDAACPLCHQRSAHIHSRYGRSVADLPWMGCAVRLELHVRRFFCPNSECTRQIFTERLPSIVAALPWFSTFFEAAKLPGGWEFTFRRIERRQEHQQAEIDMLKFLITYFLTQFEVDHLKRFAAREAFNITPTDTFEDFRQELLHLSKLGFIARLPDRGVRTLMRELDEQKTANVKKHFFITDTGKEYLKLRNQEDSLNLAQSDEP